MLIGSFVQTTSGKEKQNIMIKFAEGVNKSKDLSFVNFKKTYIKCDLALIFGFYNDLNLGEIQQFRKDIYLKHTSRGKHCLFIDADLLRFAGKIKATTTDHPTQHLRISHGSIFPNKANYFNEKSPPDRWDLLCKRKEITVKDYRKDGEHILLCLNSNPINGRGWSAQNVDSNIWALNTIKEIRSFTDRPIRIRFHPNSKKDVQKTIPINLFKEYQDISFSGGIIGDDKNIIKENSLQDDCTDCWACVVHTTSASVIPIIEGIPVFTTRNDCIAYPISNKSLKYINDPKLIDRDQWFFDLAYSCWNIEEIERGILWERFKQRLNEKGDYSKAKAKKFGL